MRYASNISKRIGGSFLTVVTRTYSNPKEHKNIKNRKRSILQAELENYVSRSLIIPVLEEILF